MARDRFNKTQMQESPQTWWEKPGFWGVTLVVAGLILLASLLSYHSQDLPRWTKMNIYPEVANPRHNWMGVMGALYGMLSLMCFGAASYLLPVVMLWWGYRLLFHKSAPSWGAGIAFTALLFSGAGWLDVQEIMLHPWSKYLSLPSPGGGIGKLLGHHFLERLFNRTGALILLGVTYFCSALYFVGSNPIDFTRDFCISCRNSVMAIVRSIQERRARRAERMAKRVRSNGSPSFLSNSEKSEKPVNAVRGEASKASTSVSAKNTTTAQVKMVATTPAVATEEAQTDLALRDMPKPQIIDSSQRKKPVNLEIKRPAHTGLKVGAYDGYELPGFDLLDYDDSEPEQDTDKDELFSVQRTIIVTLAAFGIEVTAGDITRGPTITRYEIYPSVGLRVSRITQLEADLARATKAERINILAPIPGKDTVGIEIANNVKVAVPLRELLQDEAFWSSKKRIPLALGKDVYGNTVIADLAAMPHLLVAGATGSGKSVCINSIITSILYKFRPDELRFIMVDPKVVEMQVYSKLPHLVVPVVTDPKKTVAALRWCVNEMERRYRIFAKAGVRNFESYNHRPRPEKVEAEVKQEIPEEEFEIDEDKIEAIAKAFEDGDLGPPEEIDEDELPLDTEEDPDKFPYIVVIIDELADLMQTAPAEIEMSIARIAQKARAAGIHLIVATQTPRADVVTGIIKANIPSRIAFQVSSKLDSRVILDTGGADKLVGKGDMLYLPPGSAKLERSQGAFVSDEEVERIVAHCSSKGEQRFESAIQDSIEGNGDGDAEELSDDDLDTLEKCIEVVRQEKRASTSLLQRRLRLGYTRAARMMDLMEQRGIVGPGDGAKPREILIPLGDD